MQKYNSQVARRSAAILSAYAIDHDLKILWSAPNGDLNVMQDQNHVRLRWDVHAQQVLQVHDLMQMQDVEQAQPIVMILI